MIEFFLKAEHSIYNREPIVAVREWFRFSSPMRAMNANGDIYDPLLRIGRVDADIIKEHAKEYAAWKLEIEPRFGELVEIARKELVGEPTQEVVPEKEESVQEEEVQEALIKSVEDIKQPTPKEEVENESVE